MVVLILGGLGIGLVAGWMPGQAPRSEEPNSVSNANKPAPIADTEAEFSWQKLQGRIDRPDGDATLLRRDLIDFRVRYPRSPEARRIAAVMMQLPSPLDKLPQAKVFPKELLVWRPKELVAVVGDRKNGLTNAVHAIAFSPDGQKIARAAADGSVRLWDTATLKEGPKLAGHMGPATALAIGPDGRNLATGGQDRTVHYWDMESGKLLFSLRDHKSEVKALAFHPEGKYLVSLDNEGTLKFWNPGRLQASLTLEGGKGQFPISLAFSPEGRYLACGQGDGKVILLALEKKQVVLTMATQPGPVRVLAFSPDGKTLAAGGGDGALKLHDWDGVQFKERFVLKGHKGMVECGLFSPDGKLLLSCGTDRSVRAWEVQSGKQLYAKEGLPQLVNHLALAPDGRHLAAAGQAPVVFIVRLAGPPRDPVAQTIR